MLKKYKIGNISLEIRSQTCCEDAEPFSLFLCDCEQSDYVVNVGFSSDLPKKIENPFYESQDRICVYENGVLQCFYKSRDNEDEFYACRTVNGKSIDIAIDAKYRDMLRTAVVFSLIGIEELALESGGSLLHSSFVEKNGGAILFAGPCNIGKSTQANLWKEYADATVVNGDKTLIFEKDGVFYASGLPYSGSSKDCINRVVPLKAVISLSQAETNCAQKLDSTDAFYKLYKNCYPVPYSRDLTGMLIDFAHQTCQNVPVFDYACLADESAVRYLERELCPIMLSL